MNQRIIKMLAAIAIIVIPVVYVFYHNHSTVTVNLSKTASVSAPMALVLIATFALGILFTAFITLFFGIKAYWRERQLKNRVKTRQRSEEVMIEARNLLAAGEWSKAQHKWESIVSRDPENIIARVELSKSLQGAGDIREAIKVLDAARTLDSTNTEVLFRAAELNLKLENKTAAIDNLALILYNHPNKKAAILARDLSEELERYQDALEYHHMLERFGLKDESYHDIELRLKLKVIEKLHKEDKDALLEEIRKFTKKNSAYIPSLYRLSLLENEAGNIEEAAKLLSQAAKHSGDPRYWMEAAKIWIKRGEPQRAVAAAKAGTADANRKSRTHSELELIKLYIKLNMLDEAKVAISDFEDYLKNEKIDTSDEDAQQLLILKGRCFNALGDFEKSATVWQQLSDADFHLERKVIHLEKKISDKVPARLSTP
ncbi:MAG: DUF1049 domain-containing protein [Deltaproteobacteria bacterium]|nr:DUF1049 domain-containing protein [Deltaproteobacteria bacterium]